MKTTVKKRMRVVSACDKIKAEGKSNYCCGTGMRKGWPNVEEMEEHRRDRRA